MSPKTKGSSLLSAALALILGVAPLIAQTTQSTPTNATPDATTSTTVKKAKKKKTDPSATSASASANGNTLADVKTINSTPADKPQAATSAPPQKGMVWVNTSSGVYHREGSRYYGKTKQGKYMSEADAEKAGYHVAKSEAKQ